jgi:phosphonate transport system ATP-binding protein
MTFGNQAVSAALDMAKKPGPPECLASASIAQSVVALESVCKSFAGGKIVAVHNVSFTLSRGEFLVVLGPSGAGKSTLMRCINHLAVPTAGRILVNGREVTRKHRELRKLRQGIGMVFQQFNLVLRLSVIMNVLAGRLSYRSAWRSLFYSFTHEDRVIALEALEMVGLGHKAFQRADTLSGGEQQRVGIARALAQRPSVILADEPVASLDPKIARQVLGYLKDISQRLGISVICNLHQIDFAREYAQRIIGLARGELIFDGRPDELTPEVIERIYAQRDEAALG